MQNQESDLINDLLTVADTESRRPKSEAWMLQEEECCKKNHKPFVAAVH